jgi:hypothetical protein
LTASGSAFVSNTAEQTALTFAVPFSPCTAINRTQLRSFALGYGEIDLAARACPGMQSGAVGSPEETVSAPRPASVFGSDPNNPRELPGETGPLATHPGLIVALVVHVAVWTQPLAPTSRHDRTGQSLVRPLTRTEFCDVGAKREACSRPTSHARSWTFIGRLERSRSHPALTFRWCGNERNADALLFAADFACCIRIESSDR